MARVYADVNQQMPRSYWDYDSVNITWGVLENYEVVRKIGMRPFPRLRRGRMKIEADRICHRSRKVFRSLRRHQCCQLPKMRHQGFEASQEEEDQERN
jgi:hypothetical protein